MKIAFYAPDVYSVFFPETKFIFGGVETEVYQVATGFSEWYHEDVYAVTRDHGSGERENKGVHVIPFPFTKGEGYWQKRKTLAGRISNRLGFNKDKFSSVDAFLESISPDVIYVMGLHPKLNEVATYCREAGKKFVFKAAHDMDLGGEKNDDAETEKWAGQPVSALKKIYSGADLILVQTPFQQKILKERFAREAEIILNPIAVGKEPVKAEKKYDVFWVGKNNHFKRPELLAAVAREMPEVSFCMVCNKFDASTWDKMVALLPSNVQLIESVPAPEMEKYFASSRVFLSTSNHEGFANTYLQSAACGVPVVSMCCDPNGMITGGAGILCGERIENCVKAVKHLLNDADTYGKASCAAFEYVKQHHDSRLIVGQTHRAILSLLN